MIKFERPRTAFDVYQTGMALCEHDLPFGYYPLPFSEQTARNCKKVAQELSNSILSPSCEELKNIGVTAIYELCNGPPENLLLAILGAQDGQKVTRAGIYALSHDVHFKNEHHAECTIAEETGGLRQVKCSVGKADIVTNEGIIETIYGSRATDFFKAVGQVLLYRQDIMPNGTAKIIIIGEPTKRMYRMIKLTREIGIDVIVRIS